MASKPESPAGRAANELGQPEADLSKAAQEAVEGSDGKARPPSEPPPAAGPHAEPGLQNPDATPGAGTLPSEGGQGDEAEAPGG